MRKNTGLPPFFFPMQEKSQIDPDFPPFYVIIGITACVKSDEFKSFVKIKADRVGITRLRFQNDRTPVLAYRDLFCLIHQLFPNPFMAKFVADPQLRYH